jgi:large subunit ribosomal protein L9
MSVEVLLMDDVQDLGLQGQVVAVSDGYARNYLIPGKLAEPVSAAARARLAKLREKQAQRRQALLEEAQELAGRLAGVACTIPVKVGETEKLYGSVTTGDIARVVGEQGIVLDRHAIVLEEPIKELGVFDVPVKLHPEVTASLKVWVVEE